MSTDLLTQWLGFALSVTGVIVAGIAAWKLIRHAIMWRAIIPIRRRFTYKPKRLEKTYRVDL